jgi:hypothetical protein
MTDKNWQRLKNLAIFKVWATDRELRPLTPLVALIGFIILLISALWWWVLRIAAMLWRFSSESGSLLRAEPQCKDRSRHGAATSPLFLKDRF